MQYVMMGLDLLLVCAAFLIEMYARDQKYYAQHPGIEQRICQQHLDFERKESERLLSRTSKKAQT